MSQTPNKLQAEQDGFTYILNKEDKTANIIAYNSENSKIIIFRSVIYENEEYIITKISSKSFQSSNIVSINFSSDSELKKIEKGAFANSDIESLSIPPSVVELEEGWCKKTPRLTKVEISASNKRYKNFENELVIGKEKIESEDFNELIFVNRKSTSITIPSFIKRISSYSISNTLIGTIFIPPKVTQIGSRAFFNCRYLERIEISKNSELEVIEEKAFKNGKIKRINLPSSIVELKEGSLMKLVDVQIMEGNKNYKKHDDFILAKTDKNCDEFDCLSFVNWKDKYIKIPPFIKSFRPYLFYWSRTQMIVVPSSVTCVCKKAFYFSKIKKIEFQQNSQLQQIDEYAFACCFIESIIIPCHVKIIGKNAFQSCPYLSKVDFSNNSELQMIEDYSFESTNIVGITIPSHVKRIGISAFSSCFKLKKVEFPIDSELEIIEKHAFGNTIIESLKIPSTVVELKDGWCSWTSGLNSVIICEGNQRYKNYKEGIVVGKESLESKEFNELIFVNRNVRSLKIPPFIKRIAEYSFSDSLIECIMLPVKVKEICNFAFRNCKKLRQVQFMKNSELQTIGENAFELSSIETIVIPPLVTRINDETFKFCYKLRKVTFSSDCETQAIGANAFTDAPIESITIPSNIVLEKGSLDSLSDLTKITIFPNKNQENLKYIEDGMIIGKSDNKSDIFDVLIFVRRDIESITVPSFIKRIASSAFQCCPNIQKVEFANDSEIQIIDDHAFAYSSIESFIMPPNVTQICEGTFYDCENLKKIEFPANSKLQKINQFAFNESSIEHIKIPSDVTHICSYSFIDCKKLRQVEFMANSRLNSILSSAFSRSSIAKITIPSHVTYICKSAFESCENLRYVEFLENSELKTIENKAFYRSSIEFIRIPSDVTEIYEESFSHCNHLRRVEFEKNSQLSIIGENAFSYSSIESITIPSNTICICFGTFSNCEKLRIVEFSDNSLLQTIGKNVFENSSIEKITIPPLVKEIRRRTFLNCQNLKRVEFHKNSQLKKINTFAFKSCQNVSIVIPQQAVEISNTAFQYCNQIFLEIDENSKLNTIKNEIFYDVIDGTVFLPSRLEKFNVF